MRRRVGVAAPSRLFVVAQKSTALPRMDMGWTSGVWTYAEAKDIGMQSFANVATVSIVASCPAKRKGYWLCLNKHWINFY